MDAVIQPTNSGLFNPYVTLLSGVEVYAVGVGDFNSDGLPDVAASGKDQSIPGVWSIYILLQDDYGHLVYTANYAAGLRSESLAVGDLNNDGRDDVVTANFDSSTISVYLQQEDGTMADRVNYPATGGPDALVCGDFNNDDRDDVAVSLWNNSNLRVFYQQLDGTLSYVDYATPAAGWDDIDAGDLNYDGRDDVVKVNGQLYANPNLSVFLQNESGGLNAPVPYDIGDVNANGAAVGDLNGDARSDVAMTYGGNSPNAKLMVWSQNISNTLENSATYQAYDAPGPVETADVNQDGRVDVVIAHSGWMNFGVFLQTSGGTLDPYELYSAPYGPYGPQGLEIGDVNNDGLPDILGAARYYGLVVLYHKGSYLYLTTDSDEKNVNSGGSVEFDIHVLTPNGFTDPVDLEVTGLLPGMTRSWSIDPAISPDYNSDLTINVTPDTPGGYYPLTITATSGIYQDQIQIGLNVTHWEAVYLPAIFKVKQIYYQDNFSNPASGWWVESNQIYTMGYVGGEYKISVLQPHYIVWSTAGHSLTDFEVSVEARQVSSVDTGYGLIVGMDSNNPPNQFYAFVIDPENQYWALAFKNGSTITAELGWYFSTAIKSGGEKNQLKVKRKGNYLTFTINNTVVLTDYYPSYNWSGSRRIGLTALSWEVGGADARFDNYLVTEP